MKGTKTRLRLYFCGFQFLDNNSYIFWCTCVELFIYSFIHVITFYRVPFWEQFLTSSSDNSWTTPEHCSRLAFSYTWRRNQFDWTFVGLKRLSDRCQDDIQCSESFGKGSHCRRTCVCKDGFHAVNNEKCVLYRSKLL
jgi:hypothetical protein